VKQPETTSGVGLTTRGLPYVGACAKPAAGVCPVIRTHRPCTTPGGTQQPVAHSRQIAVANSLGRCPKSARAFAQNNSWATLRLDATRRRNINASMGKTALGLPHTLTERATTARENQWSSFRSGDEHTRKAALLPNSLRHDAAAKSLFLPWSFLRRPQEASAHSTFVGRRARPLLFGSDRVRVPADRDHLRDQRRRRP